MSTDILDYTQGFDFGVGVDESTGIPMGIAIKPGEPEPVTQAGGQNVIYNYSMIESVEDFYDALNVDVKANARYMFGSASAKFQFSQSLRFNALSSALQHGHGEFTGRGGLFGDFLHIDAHGAAPDQDLDACLHLSSHLASFFAGARADADHDVELPSVLKSPDEGIAIGLPEPFSLTFVEQCCRIGKHRRMQRLQKAIRHRTAAHEID